MNLPRISFLAVTVSVFVLYLLPSDFLIRIYRLVDSNFGLSFGLMAISNATHILSFFTLSALSVFAFKRWALSVFLLAAYAVFLEFAQNMIPHRSGDMLDLQMNMIGLVAGLVFSMAVIAVRAKAN